MYPFPIVFQVASRDFSQDFSQVWGWNLESLYRLFTLETGEMWVVPKIGGKPPKWMVKIMENPIKMDDLGGKPHYFWKHPCPSLSSSDHENYLFSHNHGNGKWPHYRGNSLNSGPILHFHEYGRKSNPFTDSLIVANKKGKIKNYPIPLYSLLDTVVIPAGGFYNRINPTGFLFFVHLSSCPGAW